ncbi:phosphomannomutase/phosphoglucomutase [Patescibacteria group bacterium]|nr:phosphomannomutase/phosphoglucomutase [Patescibacteria group bacterium]
MTINPLMFRAYDIRGIAGTDLTPDTAKLIGLGLGTYIQRKFNGNRIAVGRDCRLSGPELNKSFIQGLVATGCDVTDIGQATSPLVYFASCHYDFDAAVSITASHNPKEYNGFKFVSKNARSICAADLQDILNIIQEEDFILTGTPGQVIKKDDVFTDYLAKITSIVKLKKPLKIVVDAGNGVTGSFIDPLFKALGCEIIPLFCEPDGNFPNHEANPEEIENMRDLIAAVKEHKADIGLGFDGDGDRVGVIDEKGHHYHADKLLVLLARDLLSRHPKGKIVFDIKCSKVLEEDIIKNGGEPIVSKTGHSHIETKMHEVGALLGGEVSGHMFFGENYYGFDDAFLAAAKLLEILSNTDQTFSELLQDLPVLYNTPEIKAGCPDNEKFEIVEKLSKEFQRDHNCITLDGVRINFDERSWGIIRCSNTSPNLTLRFEAPSKHELSEIMAKVVDKLKAHPQIGLDWYDKLQMD